MKYDHLVKFNGEYYPIGTEVSAGKLTDNAPDGALETNEEAGALAQKQKGTKQSRKSKEE